MIQNYVEPDPTLNFIQTCCLSWDRLPVHLLHCDESSSKQLSGSHRWCFHENAQLCMNCSVFVCLKNQVTFIFHSIIRRAIHLIWCGTLSIFLISHKCTTVCNWKKWNETFLGTKFKWGVICNCELLRNLFELKSQSPSLATTIDLSVSFANLLES